LQVRFLNLVPVCWLYLQIIRASGISAGADIATNGIGAAVQRGTKNNTIFSIELLLPIRIFRTILVEM